MKALNAMGIQAMQAAIADGTLPQKDAYLELNRRIVNRQARGDKLIPKIVEYHNDLAKLLGNPELPVPAYAPKAASPTFTGVQTFSGSVDAVADGIIQSGMDVAALIAALASRIK